MIPKRQECRLAIPESSKTFLPLFLEDLEREGRTGKMSTQSYCSCATCALLLRYNTQGKETGNDKALDPSDV